MTFACRQNLSQFLLQLRAKPVHDWPERLQEAWRLLNAEMLLPAAKALCVVLNSVSAAHRCVRAHSQQVNELEQAKARTIIRRACKLVSNGIRRAPAALRRRLNEGIFPLFRESVIDLEAIESIFVAALRTFDEFPESKSSRAAVRALREICETLFSMLAMSLRNRTEKAIVELAAASTPKHSADVFPTMAAALDGGKISVSTQSRKAMVNYVAELAEVWRRAGLRPSRTVSFLNPKHRNKFHRFAELILIAMTDPRTERLSSGELVGDDDIRKGLEGLELKFSR